ncbi:hypothetical protein [Paracoccus sp. (in: a-proteobacteria)]|uniref:hypothetical protein n=1 Tax=Paracoccus sp. TaxID=267 RepID=UPI0026E0948D|nr:hypothetical protein [Paracoccus sp. (in: a-proteobacteria)]MDO5647686.1 hypothetical protein [Paracoccus sp. (in: a-proteobacteria)]
MKRRTFIAAAVPVALSACGAQNIWATDEEVRRVRYVSPEPPSITLLTVIGIPRGEGGHSALMINGSQRVIYDPAGSWHHPHIPERNDVLYGITDSTKYYYIDYHARSTYWVAEDTIPVTREVADLAIQRAEANGAANKMFCAVESGKVLSGVPGFETVPRGFSPIRLREWFLRQPNVQSRQYRDGDVSRLHNVTILNKER